VSPAAFPLTGRGDVNTYALFAEHFANLTSPRGRAGVIVPTGIATDATTAPFFAALVERRLIAKLASFYEVRRWFKGTDERKPFCLLTIGTEVKPLFAFEIKETNGTVPTQKWFHLRPEQIAALNPNTKTLPIFRADMDAQITTGVYGRLPVFMEEAKGVAGNLWGASFVAMFHMANDSGLFRTGAELLQQGLIRQGRYWAGETDQWVPLYEGKMFSLYDHRFGTFEGIKVRPPAGASLPHPEDEALSSLACEVEPWYWVSDQEVARRIKNQSCFLFVFSDVTNTTAARTFVVSCIPQSGVNHKNHLLY
jgi:hypothetical protein